VTIVLFHDTGVGVAEVLCDQKQWRARLRLPGSYQMLGVGTDPPGQKSVITRPWLQRYLSEMTLSPDGVLGSSMARRDKTSAWSAIYLL
jgi:hypothetical protein